MTAYSVVQEYVIDDAGLTADSIVAVFATRELAEAAVRNDPRPGFVIKEVRYNPKTL